MTFKEEALKSRVELRYLRQENARLINANRKLHERIARLEREGLELRKESRLLKGEQKILQETIAKQQKQIESFSLLVEELRGMVFGKKNKKDDDKQSDGKTGNSKTESSQEKGRVKYPIYQTICLYSLETLF
jgi:hypothetical protein